MAKKLATDGLNVSQEIRDALGELGPKTKHTVIADYLTKKFPGNAQIAKAVNSKVWYQTVYTQRQKMKAGKKIASRKLMRAAIRSGGDNAGALRESAMIFALKAGGIEKAIAVLQQLAEKLNG